MREKWAKKKEDETKVDPEPEPEPPEYGPFYNTELPFVGGLTKIWCWNCDGVRSVMRNGKFQEFIFVSLQVFFVSFFCVHLLPDFVLQKDKARMKAAAAFKKRCSSNRSL